MLEGRRGQLTALAAGSGVFLVSTALVWDDNIPPAEEQLFEFINGWPDWMALPLWPVMQFGMVVAPFVAGGLAWYLTRKRQPALALVGTGFSMWLLAKLVKLIVDRPRPGQLLDEVAYRVDGGPDGLGFVSGHAVVGFAIATIATPYVGKRWAAVLWGLATGAATLRVYVGAHLPLDSIGGAGLGVAAGAAALLIVRRR
jgi:undecaprenyl-diphosphatase